MAYRKKDRKARFHFRFARTVKALLRLFGRERKNIFFHFWVLQQNFIKFILTYYIRNVKQKRCKFQINGTNKNKTFSQRIPHGKRSVRLLYKRLLRRGTGNCHLQKYSPKIQGLQRADIESAPTEIKRFVTNMRSKNNYELRINSAVTESLPLLLCRHFLRFQALYPHRGR